MNKICYLDFDGVLRVQPENSSWFSEMGFCLKRESRLFEILREHDYQVVISSDWRFSFNLNKVKKLLPKLSEIIYENNWGTSQNDKERWEQISDHIDSDSVEEFIILDDLRDLFDGAPDRILNRLVLTEGLDGGISEENFKEIEKLLKTS